MVDGVTELVGKSRRIPFVLHTNPSALEVSSTSGLIFLGHSYVLVPQMAPLDDTEIERYHLGLSKKRCGGGGRKGGCGGEWGVGEWSLVSGWRGCGVGVG
ncbi:hypothetical protein Tco_1494215 [Tanacetum coccineum]